MTECNQSAQELLSKAYNPQIAVIVSPEAQSLCGRNNLKFTELISPFSTLTTSLVWQEPGGSQVSPKCFRITPVDIASWKPPKSDAQKNKKLLLSRISQILPNFLFDSQEKSSESETRNSSPSPFCSYKLGKPGLTQEYSIEVPSSTPWFECWRETVLKLHSEQQYSQHEFMNHFIGCMMVISSSEGKNADEFTVIIGKLSKLQQQHQMEWPNCWFLPSTLKFYLILHDNSQADSKSAEDLYQSLRTTYTGNACYMLKINSGNADLNKNSKPSLVPDPWASSFVQEQFYEKLAMNNENISNEVMIDPVTNTNLLHPLSPEEEFGPLYPHYLENGNIGTNSIKTIEAPQYFPPRGQFMTPEDMKNIQVTVNEFTGKALLPYVERQTRVLYESIVNRRSMSKSFLSATKRLFGTTSKAVTNVIYGSDSLEITSRKLADLYFLFGNYTGAYQLYHQLKKDFQADQAWAHYASSLEMAALSHFMMTQIDSPIIGARSFPVHYVNEAIRVYLENCRMADSAIRCAILSCECLKQLENYGEAAAVFIRMTAEDCDLRSALMLEQAASAFIKLNSPRKYALHTVLAGHRYAKAGLRSHSLNSYFQAAQIYYGRGWRFAEDHVFFTIAKHQSFLQSNKELAQHLKKVLRWPTPKSPAQQLYHKEFLATHPPTLPEKVPLLPSTRHLNVRNINLRNTKIRETKVGFSSSGLLFSEHFGSEDLHSELFFSNLYMESPCLRLEYSLLKPLDALSYFGLLKLHNLTQDHQVEVSNIEFKPRKLVIEQVMSIGISTTGEKTPAFLMEPAESRSLVLRVKENPEFYEADRTISETQSNPHHQPLFLYVNWQYISSELPSSQTTDTLPSGSCKLRIRETDVTSRSIGSMTESNIPTAFQMYHKSHMSHNFETEPCCICSVELIVNCKLNSRIGIEIIKDQKQRSESIGDKPRVGNWASSEEVFFIGQTKWIIDIVALESTKLIYQAAVSHPGIYNIGPLINVKKYIKSESEEVGFLVESEERYSLHSPLIVAHSVHLIDA